MVMTAARPQTRSSGPGQWAPPRPPRIDDHSMVVGLTWPQFLAYMRWAWKPGQHIALIGPTGEGKTTFASGLLSLRDYVMALDPKGEDEVLTASGFQRVTWLPNEPFSLGRKFDHFFHTSWAEDCWDCIDQAIAMDLPARIIIGGPSRTDAQDTANQDLMGRSFGYAREAGGWTVYVDEFELVSSQRMFRLGPRVERMLISARSAGTSVITSFQAAAWVSKHATRQARFAVIWPTGDRDMIKNIARSMGRDWLQLAAAVDELPPYHVCVVPRGKNGGPFVCTSAPRLALAA